MNFRLLFVFFLFLCGSVFGLGNFSPSVLNLVVPYVIDSDPIIIDRGFTLSRTTGAGATVTNWGGGTIEFTIAPVPSLLDLDRLSCSPPNPAITWAYSIPTRKLTITAANTIPFSDLQATLRTVTFSTKGVCAVTRSITIKIKESPFYLEATGHHYLSNSDLGLANNSATAARDLADASTVLHYGLHGYLVTITSAAENVHASGRTGTRSWIALSDIGHENVYKWTAGPELGQTATYTNWDGGQPDNDSTIDWIVTNFNTNTWNDEPGTTARPYTVEFGGLPSDAATSVVSIQVLFPNTLMLANPY